MANESSSHRATSMTRTGEPSLARRMIVMGGIIGALVYPLWRGRPTPEKNED